jgi:hypothetical protein
MSVFTEEYKRKHLRLHNKLRKLYGSANTCVSDNCNRISTNYCWAKIAGRKYTTDINDYVQLCYSCHRKYDVLNKEMLSLDDIENVTCHIRLKKYTKPIYEKKGRSICKYNIKQLSINNSTYALINMPKEAIGISIDKKFGKFFYLGYNLHGKDGFGSNLFFKDFGSKNNYPKDMQIACHLGNPTNEIMSIFSENKLNLNDYENYILLKTTN